MNNLLNVIEAIIFDMGGTLRSSMPQDVAHGRACMEDLVNLIGADLSAGEMHDLLALRAGAYSRWSRRTLIELSEQELWTKWMLPDWPSTQIAPIAVTLNQLWRESIGKRVVFPETKPVVTELFRRGYRLGLASNTTSSVESPALLRELKLSGFMDTVLLSCVVGMRKPGPGLLLEAAKRMGIPPERCAYVGDRINRDVAAARQAGFARVVILGDDGLAEAAVQGDPVGLADDTTELDIEAAGIQPDYRIHNLNELLALFPPRTAAPPEEVYNVSLSTMWWRKNFDGLGDFFEAARRMGFSHVELNHMINSEMLAPVNLNGYKISSVHEPCPADVSVEQLKERDWLISSPDEEKRRRGVEAIRRSIELAAKLGSQAIVVHCGLVTMDLTEEKQLRALFENNENGDYLHSEEYSRIFKGMQEFRAARIGPHIEAVKKSLKELLDYARPHGIRLGLENRYHYYDIPSPDEMAELLALAGPDELGVVYDIGHAQALDRLGFYPRGEWLQRFGDRMIEVHLHDVNGVSDHFAPGLGEVDYSLLAGCLPAEAIRVFEVQGNNTPEQVRAGLRYLEERGIVQQI